MVSDQHNDQSGKTAAAGPPRAAELPREERRKAALKANLARRKAQARARSATAPGDATDCAADNNE